MKSKSLFAAAVVILAPALAFAGSKTSANVKLDQPVTVAGTQLAAGQYKVIWQGSGSDVTVSFTEGKKTFATVPAKLVNNKTDQEAIETSISPDKTPVLQAIDLNRVSLQFQADAPTSGN